MRLFTGRLFTGAIDVDLERAIEKNVSTVFYRNFEYFLLHICRIRREFLIFNNFVTVSLHRNVVLVLRRRRRVVVSALALINVVNRHWARLVLG